MIIICMFILFLFIFREVLVVKLAMRDVNQIGGKVEKLLATYEVGRRYSKEPMEGPRQIMTPFGQD